MIVSIARTLMPNGGWELSLSRLKCALWAGLAKLGKRVLTAVKYAQMTGWSERPEVKQRWFASFYWLSRKQSYTQGWVKGNGARLIRRNPSRALHQVAFETLPRLLRLVTRGAAEFSLSVILVPPEDMWYLLIARHRELVSDDSLVRQEPFKSPHRNVVIFVAAAPC